MRLIDVTLPLCDEYPSWPGDRPFSHDITSRVGEGGADYSISRIETSTHFGTHIDAPSHFIEGGKNVDELELGLLIGPCLVVEIDSGGNIIGDRDLDKIVPNGTKRVLIKTINSSRFLHDPKFHKEYVSLSVDAVELLLKRGVRLLGIDYYSIAPFESPGDAHRAFLRSNDTAALESVDLSNIEPGEYHLICLPMKIKDSSGAPARVILGTE